MRTAIVAIDGISDTGLGLLLDVFTAADLLRDRIDDHIEAIATTVCSTQPHVRSAYGLTLEVACDLGALADDPPDHLIVPGFGVIGVEAVIDAVTATVAVPVIGRLHEQGVASSAACSGTFVLAEAGVFDGRAATTSWWLGPTFRQRYPAVDLDESEALVFADTIITAGAALAHLDLALAVVRRVSPALAEAVSDYLAVGDRPRQGELVRPSLLAHEDPVLSHFDQLVRERIAQPLDLTELAADLGVSRRTLQRLTSTTLGMSPVRFVQQLRLERAVDLLRTTDDSMAAIARAVGYRGATTLATLIRQRRGATPEQIRRSRLGTVSTWMSTPSPRS